MSRLLVLLSLAALLPPAQAQAQSAVAPIATYAVTTKRRSLRNLPLKAVITTAAGWKRVTEDLQGAPPSPDFKKSQVCVLVVADVSGGAHSWVSGIKQTKNKKDIEVLLERRQGRRDLYPHIKCFFIVLPRLEGGVLLQHRTLLGIGGKIVSNFHPLKRDRDPTYLPELGPDLRLSVAMRDGSAPPRGIKLRYEGRRPGKRLAHNVATIAFPKTGLPFPTFRRGFVSTHIYAAHTKKLRSRNPLVLKKMPANGPDGSPLVVRHRFLLEPIPHR